MALERSDPIPTGYYWLDLVRPDPDDVNEISEERTKDAMREFAWWVHSFNPRTVHVVKVDGAWVLFRVDVPSMRWPINGEIKGLPNRAPWGMATTRDSTVQRRDPEGIVEFWVREGIELMAKAQDAVEDSGLKLPSFTGMGVVVLLGLYLLSQRK